jgi:hypothetical protein
MIISVTSGFDDGSYDTASHLRQQLCNKPKMDYDIDCDIPILIVCSAGSMMLAYRDTAYCVGKNTKTSIRIKRKKHRSHAILCTFFEWPLSLGTLSISEVVIFKR